MTRPASVKAFPDITGYASKNESWHALDEATYDGAEDAGYQCVGYGSTAEEALADYDEKFRENAGAA